MTKNTKVKIQLLTNQIESRRRAGFKVTVEPQIVEATEEQLKALNADSWIGVWAVANAETAQDIPSREQPTSDKGESEEVTAKTAQGENDVPSKNSLLRHNSLDELRERAKSLGVETSEDDTKAIIADAIIAKLSK